MANYQKEIKKNFLYYETAKKQIETYLFSINNEYNLEEHNPISSIKSRIKSYKSIIAKLKKKHIDLTLENLNNLNDIVGARIVVEFIDNIYEIKDKIIKNKNIKILEIKDYVRKPKESGYRGVHIIVSLPISINGIIKNIKCEIQIRTTAMDFWATKEHLLNYKNNNKENQKEWLENARIVWDLDVSMNNLYLKNTKAKKSQINMKFNNLICSLENSIKLEKIGGQSG